MADVKEVLVRLKAVNEDYKKGMTEAGDSTSQFGKVAALAMVAGAAAVGAFVLSAANATDDYGKSMIGLSRVTGDSIETVSKLAFAGSQFGLTSDQLSVSMTKMEKAAASNKPVFDDLGISTRDANGSLKSSHEILLSVADAFHSMPDGPLKAKDAIDIFGRSGKQMIGMLDQGRAGILALENQAKDYGLVLSGDNVDAIKANVTAHREMDAAMKGFQLQVGEKALPMLTSFTGGLTQVVQAAGKVPPQILEIGAGLTVLAIAGPKVVSTVQTLTSGMGALGGVASVGAVAGIVYFTKAMMDADKAVSDFGAKYSATINYQNLSSATSGLNEEGAAVDKLGQSWNDLGLLKAWPGNWGQYGVYHSMSDQLDQDAAHVDNLKTIYKNLGDQLGVSNEQATRLAASVGKDLTQFTGPDSKGALQVFKDLNAGLITTTDASKRLSDIQTKAADSAGDDAAKQKALNDELTKENNTIKGMFDPQFAFIDSLNKQRDAQAKNTQAITDANFAQLNYTGAVQQYGAQSPQALLALKNLTAAQQAQSTSLDDVTKGALGVTAATRTLENAYETGAVSADDLKSQLQDLVRAGQLTSGQANDMTNRLLYFKGAADSINNTVNVRVNVDAAAAQQAMDRLNASLSSYGPGYSNAAAHAGGQFGGHATGGQLSEGWNMVGEQGPEPIWMKGGIAQVFTASSPEAKAMKSGQSGGSSGPSLVVNAPITVNAGIGSDGVQIGYQAAAAISKALNTYSHAVNG